MVGMENGEADKVPLPAISGQKAQAETDGFRGAQAKRASDRAFPRCIDRKFCADRGKFLAYFLRLV